MSIYLYGAFDCMSLWYHVRIFRVNLHSIVAWMSWNSLFETGAISEFKWLQRDSNPKPLGKLAKWLNSTVLILTYLHDAFSCMSLLCHVCVLIPLQSHDLLCLFNSIWIKWHFRFVCPVLYFKQISIGCQRWTFHAVCNTT